MPRRDDLKSILILGSGPIVIGQACEFDYSGTQACRALRAEGYRVILVNSNPATIMTDPELADATYVEPLIPEVVERIVRQERPDAILPTVGGQTGINLALALDESGALAELGVELLGASAAALRLGEDRLLFKQAMEEVGLAVPQSGYATSMDEAAKIAEELGLPLIIRPSFTLGGEGGGVVYNRDELDEVVRAALAASPVHRVLIEQSVLGWKEFELEVMRDHLDNCIVVCSVENVDAMGVHTGDSITVAPQQTLSDHEYQAMRDDAFTVIRRVGVATGGSNIQFAVDPKTGERVVIEMNPRVSRSSALASKATGFPIAKIAALLAVGYTLDEIPNTITGKTWAAFEPSLDYTVVKIPRWAFEKFPETPSTLGTAMKSVGEVMALGSTFQEALMKGLAALELDGRMAERERRMSDPVRLRRRLSVPNWERLFAVIAALRQGWTVDEVSAVSHIDPWFLREIREVVELEAELACWDQVSVPAELLRRGKAAGLSDARIAELLSGKEAHVRERRIEAGVRRVYKRVDTCAAEFPATTPYLYSTFGDEDEVDADDRQKVVILGSGPNRIGQGIEFDYCCVHAAFALREMGYETVMVNCNPETVSTDYDTSDRLYFEPLTLEHVLSVIEREQPLVGVVLQLGGQTPLKLARGLAAAGVPILGTTPDAIDLAEDRERFGALLAEEGIAAPEHGHARTFEEALVAARRIGFPVMVRPSYVLGGRAMVVCHDETNLEKYMRYAAEVSPDHPVLLDRFLEDAVELDLDLLADGTDTVVCGILQHIEEAGIHSGDSAAVLPPWKADPAALAEMERIARRLAARLGVVGLMNVQFAVYQGKVFVLEVNPRASRTVPFIAKAVGLPLAGMAAQVMAGKTLRELGLTESPQVPRFFVKVPVFPFNRFPGVDPQLGPEMKSTGEVMGIGETFGEAFAKGWIAANNRLPLSGTAFLTVHDRDKRALVPVALRLEQLGFKLVATDGTAEHLRGQGVPVETVLKLHQGRPHVVDHIKNGEVDLIVNTPLGGDAYREDAEIRRAALAHRVPCITTLSGAMAAAEGIAALRKGALSLVPLQGLAAAEATSTMSAATTE
ncbi:MAG TPA: carbamoyl-phosphate synthase large subunit [Thermoanaerobaculia bacterium]|nr:carbamoyl-phosphate synthase large subunit [Thermoanaerobaculia bacterium]HXT50280.1 carbamoyl-phosphate synthase large subunit [Thermoanaerobaculia bacterium]